MQGRAFLSFSGSACLPDICGTTRDSNKTSTFSIAELLEAIPLNLSLHEMSAIARLNRNFSQSLDRRALKRRLGLVHWSVTVEHPPSVTVEPYEFLKGRLW